MVSFIVIDLTLLALFTLAVILFLYTHKKNLKREGLLYLYRTKLGLKFIETTSKKYVSILKPLQYLVILSGYILMVIMIYLLIKTLFFYFQQSADSPIAKVPAVFPLIPYFPQLFNLDSFFPPFYFAYFIIAIAIVAVSHEFSHGIFARLNKIKIHSTGFAFLGPFLGAFVEQDENQMNKAKKFPQLAILAAGTFANVLMALLFIILIAIFFSLAYSPQGIIFDSYATSVVSLSDIQIPSELNSSKELVEISSDGITYLATPQLLSLALSKNASKIAVYDDAPAIRTGLKGAIIEADSMPIKSYEEFKSALEKHKPNEKITLKTYYNKNISTYEITLSERNGKAFLGVGIIPPRTSGFSGIWYKLISFVKDPNVFYVSKLEFADFIYDLLWWVIIINILVALFNMFPAGILDGGRFLYLTIWGITGKEKLGKFSLKIMTWLLLAVIALMMAKWVFNLF